MHEVHKNLHMVHKGSCMHMHMVHKDAHMAHKGPFMHMHTVHMVHKHLFN